MDRGTEGPRDRGTEGPEDREALSGRYVPAPHCWGLDVGPCTKCFITKYSFLSVTQRSRT